jgi:hypothetical protein
MVHVGKVWVLFCVLHLTRTSYRQQDRAWQVVPAAPGSLQVLGGHDLPVLAAAMLPSPKNIGDVDV